MVQNIDSIFKTEDWKLQGPLRSSVIADCSIGQFSIQTAIATEAKKYDEDTHLSAPDASDFSMMLTASSVLLLSKRTTTSAAAARCSSEPEGKQHVSISPWFRSGSLKCGFLQSNCILSAGGNGQRSPKMVRLQRAQRKTTIRIRLTDKNTRRKQCRGGRLSFLLVSVS